MFNLSIGFENVLEGFTFTPGTAIIGVKGTATGSSPLELVNNIRYGDAMDMARRLHPRMALYEKGAAAFFTLVLATMLSEGEHVLSLADGAKMKILGERPDDEKTLKKEAGHDIVAAFQQNEKSNTEMAGTVKILFGIDNTWSVKLGQVDGDGYKMFGAGSSLGGAWAGGIFAGVNKEKGMGKIIASAAYGTMGYEVTVTYPIKPPTPESPGRTDKFGVRIITPPSPGFHWASEDDWISTVGKGQKGFAIPIGPWVTFHLPRFW